jgi:lipid A 3-O-deacylase
MYKYIILIYTFISVSLIFGQDSSPKLYDDFKRLEFGFDNDILNNTDYYYTEGFEVSFSSPNLSKFFLFDLFSAPKTYQYDKYGIGVEHKMYTPIDKNNINNLNGDRPFSSYFLINMNKETRKYSSKSSNYFQIGIGLLGNVSGGKEIQNFVHKLLPKSKTVIGWDSQIKNEFLLDVLYDYEKGLIHSKYFDLMILGRAETGTLRNNIGIGSHLRIGWMPDYYTQNIGKNNSMARKFFMYSEINSNSRWVIYDATLLGRIFNNSNDIYVLKPSEIEDFVHQIDVSLNLRFKRIKLGLVQTFLSREIKNGLAHKYGSLKLSCDF